MKHIPNSEKRGGCTQDYLWEWLHEQSPCDWETDPFETNEKGTSIFFWTKDNRDSGEEQQVHLILIP